MVSGGVVEIPTEIFPNAIVELGKIGLWLQTLGIIILLWIGFQAVSLWLNKKRHRTLKEIKKDLKRIESKFDKLNKK